MFIKNQIKNTEAQIGEILRTPSLVRNLLALIKKECYGVQRISSLFGQQSIHAPLFHFLEN